MEVYKKYNMIEYSIMSPSGKVGVDWYFYDQALMVYHQMKSLWVDPYKSQSWHILYHFKLDDLDEQGSLTDEEFLNDCVPKLYYRINYIGMGSYIGSKQQLDDEIELAIESKMLNELHYTPIIISDFELKLLPEFEGF
jgi:hypothetical protein